MYPKQLRKVYAQTYHGVKPKVKRLQPGSQNKHIICQIYILNKTYNNHSSIGTFYQDRFTIEVLCGRSNKICICFGIHVPYLPNV